MSTKLGAHQLSNFLYSKIFKKFSNYTFRIVPFWPSEAKDAFYKSDVEAVTITSLKSFKDSSDYKLAEANQDYEVTTQYRKVKKSKKSYKRAKMKISKEIRDDVKNFTDDPDVLDVELTVSLSGKQRKMSVKSLQGHPPAFPITFNKKNDLNSRGQPTLEAFKRESDKVVEDWNI